MPDPARVLVSQNQVDSPASRSIQVHTVTKMCHQLVPAKIPLFLAKTSNMTNTFWGVSTHPDAPPHFSFPPQIQTWISHSGPKLEVFIPFLGKYHHPVSGRCCQTCTPRSWVGELGIPGSRGSTLAEIDPIFPARMDSILRILPLWGSAMPAV